MKMYILLVLVAALCGQEFDVATIKLSDPGRSAKTFDLIPGGGLGAVVSPRRDLIETAYDVRQLQIQGGPSWATRDNMTSLPRLCRKAMPILPRSATPSVRSGPSGFASERGRCSPIGLIFGFTGRHVSSRSTRSI